MSSPSLRSPGLERFYQSRAPSPVAFLDESMRETAGPGVETFYQMAAVILPHDRLDDIREGLVDLAGGTYWHTTEKFRGSNYDRGDIVDMVDYVTRESEWNVVAVKMPLAGASRMDLARARGQCLDRLVRNITRGAGSGAVRAIVADNNKDQALNKLDQQVVGKLRDAGAIHEKVSLTHGRMGQEPLLWSADAMSWSVRRNIAVDDGRFIKPTLDEGKLTVINAVDGAHLEMKHPLGASAKTRGPSAQGPGLSGSAGYDVASRSMVSARDDVDHGVGFAEGNSVGRDLSAQIRALGRRVRAEVREEPARSSMMAEVSNTLTAIRGAVWEREEAPTESVPEESRTAAVQRNDIAPPSM